MAGDTERSVDGYHGARQRLHSEETGYSGIGICVTTTNV